MYFCYVKLCLINYLLTMKTFIIAGVRCTLETSKKLCLELPTGMDGRKLQAWSDKHRDEAFEALTDVESSEDTDEPESCVQA